MKQHILALLMSSDIMILNIVIRKIIRSILTEYFTEVKGYKDGKAVTTDVIQSGGSPYAICARLDKTEKLHAMMYYTLIFR